ncbi:MAG: PrgI family protein [Candidatus Moraniibacteriota bacterium]
MMFNVPQFVDVEDKIAGPLTWRQLLWMIGMGVTLLVLFNLLSTAVFFVVAVFVILLFSALAFYRPNKQPLILTVMHGITFLFRPKVAIWERPSQKPLREVPTEAPPLRPVLTEKKVTAEELKNLAHIVDRHGRL